MERNETKQLVSKIKAYYYYFNLEKDSLEEWCYKLKNYDYEDILEKLEEHLKGENSKEPPKLHYLIKNLLTIEQKQKAKNDFIVECNLCHRWMPLKEYDSHYDRCLSIEYLITKAKESGKNITREELENTKPDILAKLYERYKPQEMAYKPQKI